MTLHRSARREREPASWPTSSSSVVACSTNAVGPQTNTCRAGPAAASVVGVEPRAALARVGDRRPRPGGDLVREQQRRPRAHGEHDRDVGAPRRERVADHRPQRHDPRAAADQQQRPAVVGVPGERASSRPAQLELVALAQLARQPRRHLARVEVLDAQLEGLVLGRRGDRVRPLGAVAVGRGQPDVDALAGAVTLPAGHVERDRARAGRVLTHAGDRHGAPVQSP